MLRTAVILGGLAFALLVPTGLVIQKERVLRSDKVLLLELAPVDPRSLMQGDYMILDYAISQDRRGDTDTLPADGRVVLKLDANGVGTFARYDTPETPLAADELKLRYRVRKGRFQLGAESFFFQEGHADRYEGARYGELRVADDGDSVLVGLRDAQRQPLGR